MNFSLRSIAFAAGASCLLPAVARAEDAAPPAGKQKKADRKEHKERPYEALRDARIQLEYFPVGMVVPEGKLRLTDLIPMHPAGFRANDYSLSFTPVYGLGHGWEVSAGATLAERLGKGGEAAFFGVGVQKQLVQDRHGLPAISVGSYGMTGPHEHHSGTFFLAATKRLLGGQKRGFGLFMHGGLRYERFGSNDYGESDGLRPYGGVTVAATRRLFFSGEIGPPQPWEIAEVYAVRGTYLIHKSIGVSGGIRGDGYRTYPFAEVVF